MSEHVPGRGPYLGTGSGGTPVSTVEHMTRTRTKSQPEATVIDPKTKKARKIPRKTYAHTIRSARG